METIILFGLGVPLVMYTRRWQSGTPIFFNCSDSITTTVMSKYVAFQYLTHGIEGPSTSGFFNSNDAFFVLHTLRTATFGTLILCTVRQVQGAMMHQSTDRGIVEFDTRII